ncbi:hypothetical protein AB0D08_26915 [Kitasatospora sp. NPDC048540]|uniref:hypothetical protein n=1 Tax=Kitasatospora sp. NPDC048540 TaxID=3155634 RepID=UPI0033D27BDD
MSGTTTARHAVRLALVCAGLAGALSVSASAAFADGTPSAAPAAPSAAAPAARPSVAPSAVPSVAPTAAAGRGTGAPQVREVPKGGAQTGEGSTGPSTATLAGGTGLALAGVTGIGFAVARRRAGARG